MKGPVRRSHRWLMLLVGGQVLFWSLSGLYMVWFDIYYIQGEHFLPGPSAMMKDVTGLLIDNTIDPNAINIEAFVLSITHQV